MRSRSLAGSQLPLMRIACSAQLVASLKPHRVAMHGGLGVQTRHAARAANISACSHVVDAPIQLFRPRRVDDAVRSRGETGGHVRVNHRHGLNWGPTRR
ncbi:hypothetical protein ABZP36_026092 [Zizania latifolia]